MKENEKLIVSSLLTIDHKSGSPSRQSANRLLLGVVVIFPDGTFTTAHPTSQRELGMKLFWRESKPGRHLMIEDDNGELTRVGFIIRTPRGFDGLAQTKGYAPERSQNDFPSIEEAQAFVESFQPWAEFGGTPDLTVEQEIRPRPS